MNETQFYYFNRFLQRVPIPFLHSSIIGSVIDCALMACSLDHRDANASVMKFFYDLLYSGRMLQVFIYSVYNFYLEYFRYLNYVYIFCYNQYF